MDTRMSLVKASILQELDFSIYFKRWLQSKRGNHYHNATIEYSAKLREIFKDDLKRRQRARIESLMPSETANALSSGLVVIRLGDSCNIDDKPVQTEYNGICISRSNFPGAQVDDRVFLVPLKDGLDPAEEDTSKKMVFGTVVAVDSNQIRIRFRSTLKLEIEEPNKNSIDSEELENEKLDKLCEKNFHEDSDNDAKEVDGVPNDEKDGESSDPESEEKVDVTSERGSLKTATREEPEKKANEEVNDSRDDDKAEVAPIRVRSANYGIRMEPKEDKSSANFMNCFGEALRRFEKQSCSAPLHRCLLGYYNNRDDSITPRSRMVNISELPKPKHNQELAIEQSIKRRISLIEGPAGSGKTMIAALVASNVARVKDYKVLVCSPLQSTVDTLVELIDRVRSIETLKLPSRSKLNSALGSTKADHTIGRKRRNDSDCDLAALSDCRDLNRLVDDEIYTNAWHKVKGTYRGDTEEMHVQAMKRVACCSSWRRKKIEKRILNQANIICCTTTQTGSPLIEDLNFDMLILDDAQLVSEVDCIVPLMTKGLKQVTLLSDMRRQIRLSRVQRISSLSVVTKQSKDLIGTAVEDNTIEKQIHEDTSAVVPEQSVKENGVNEKTPNGGPSFTETLAERRKKAVRERTIDRKDRPQTNSDRQSESNLNVSNAGPNSSNEPSSQLGGLFERWLAIGLPAVDLRYQFRMHETLSSFTNYHFYLNRSKNDQDNNGKLAGEIIENLLVDENNFDWLPKKNCLTAIFLAKSSSINEKLDEFIEKLLMREKIQGKRIGVIFNRKQESFADKWQSRSIKHEGDVQCGTIENFLGQERDFILLVAGCCDESKASQFADVASSSKLERNFMIDDCTLNLALTRARLGMFILTDYELTSDIQQNGGPSTSTTVSSSQVLHTTDHYCLSWRKLREYYGMNQLIA